MPNNLSQAQLIFRSKLKSHKKKAEFLQNKHKQIANRYDAGFLKKTKLHNPRTDLQVPFSKLIFKTKGPLLRELAFMGFRGLWGVWFPWTNKTSSPFFKPFFNAWASLGGLVTTKLRYKGKSFKWYRKRGGLVLRFGHSHLVFQPLFQGIRFKKKGRMGLIIFGSNLLDMVFWAAEAKRWRPMNAYHGRGLRFGKQVFYKKPGKVSAYR